MSNRDMPAKCTTIRISSTNTLPSYSSYEVQCHSIRLDSTQARCTQINAFVHDCMIVKHHSAQLHVLTELTTAYRIHDLGLLDRPLLLLRLQVNFVVDAVVVFYRVCANNVVNVFFVVCPSCRSSSGGGIS